MVRFSRRNEDSIGLRITKFLTWIVLSLFVLALDQVSKMLAVDMLSFTPTQLLPFLSLTLACNTGAAFSIFEGHSEILAALGIFFAIFFVFLIIRLPENRRLEGLAYSLILAGAVGNVIDRLTRGCVVDFIHVHWNQWSFPIFNLADSAITIGAALWIFSLMRSRAESDSHKKDSGTPIAD
ncbi:MAG: signal peptidase II [Gammaproteobacteria bacterium]|nr:signal peptidase II [Gammaproteobacteria bacterium]